MSLLKHIANYRFQSLALQYLIACLVLASVTVFCYWFHVNLATCALLYVIVIALLSRTGTLVSSIATSIAAAVCLMYLAPPKHSFRVNDRFDIVAIAAFLITSLIIARLVSKLRGMAEEAISSVNRKLVDAEERERNRIARDLHDDISQRLAILTTELEQVRQDIPDSATELQSSVAAVQSQISTIASDVQTISHALHSSNLEYLGIDAAMRGFCMELAQQRKVEIDFKSKDLPVPLSPEISLCLFRVLQEALHNSAKHSRALQFKVELFGTSEAIHLAVHDSGIGFDPQAAMRGRGLGLTSMKERLKLVKGRFSINSHPGTGTTIHAWVPVLDQHSETYPQGKVS